MVDMGRMRRVDDLRSVWMDEVKDFTPWLAREDNIKILGDAIGLELEVEVLDGEKGNFHVDVLCKDTATGGRLLIENQLRKTDHMHLGKLLTYAAGLEASGVVWISREFTDEHRAALDWLNENTGERVNFFGLEIELWRIGSSPVAPKFNMVCKPNQWTKRALGTLSSGLTDSQLIQLDFWREFVKFLEEAEYSYSGIPKPRPQNWMSFSVRRTGFSIAAVASAWDSEKNTFGGELRMELVLRYQDSIAYFEELLKLRRIVEEKLGESPTWYRKENVKMCRIYVRRVAVDIFNRSKWRENREWLYERLIRFQEIFRPIVAKLELSYRGE